MTTPLAGLRVLELSRWIAGPFCALVLGDLGADVIKIESHKGGDESRVVQPQVNGESIYFMVFNRNKRGVTLNFRHPKGPAIIRQMVAQADVLIENFRPGTMEAMGCSYSTLSQINPRLVMASVSGFGQDGPLAKRPCFDSIVQAKSGIEALTGWPDQAPALVGTSIADYITALYATVGILAALRRRDETGRGQLVDVALLDSLLSTLMTAIPEYLLLGNIMQRQGNRARYVVPTGAFKTKNGWVQISGGQDNLFVRLAKAMGQEGRLQDPRFATVAARVEHIEEVHAFVEAWTLQHTGEEIEAILERAEVPSSKVCTVEDVVKNPQVHHRQQIVEVPHPKTGKVPLHGVTIKLSESPGSIRRPAPTLGQHNHEIYGEWLGLSTAEVTALREEGAI
jgi:crotonobetainyl-CoA:carnitine CoA-transferase CaiB-like acyl-CoA transferase